MLVPDSYAQDLKMLHLAFYSFYGDARGLRAELQNRCAELGFGGTLLLASEGINGVIVGLPDKAEEFAEEIRVRFGCVIKKSWSRGMPFRRMLVKIKKELIPLGDPAIRPQERTGKYIAAKELKAWFQERKDFTLLDTRNVYEIEYGTFTDAVHPNLRHFRNFPGALASMDLDRTKPLVMFCTGGIRCEKASVVAMDQGFQEVYQLEGGIFQYFQDVGQDHYSGDCFVFDERETISPHDMC